MGSPVTSVFAEMKEKSGGVAGGMMGKLIGSIAGILVIITILKATFYLTRYGHRSVLMRGGKPVEKHSGEWCLAFADVFRWMRLWQLSILFYRLAEWRKSKQVGKYKVKRPGIRMKFPGYYDAVKVDVQRRSQPLDPFDVDCPDGQRHFRVELITRVPCDDDGVEYHDYPALKLIHSFEADELFESFGGTGLVELLERIPPEIRDDRANLNRLLNEQVGDEFDRCAYLLEGVNVRERSLTAIQKAIHAFAPPKLTLVDDVEDHEDEAQEPDNVLQMPHQIIMTEALRDSAPSS